MNNSKHEQRGRRADKSADGTIRAILSLEKLPFPRCDLMETGAGERSSGELGLDIAVSEAFREGVQRRERRLIEREHIAIMFPRKRKGTAGGHFFRHCAPQFFSAAVTGKAPYHGGSICMLEFKARLNGGKVPFEFVKKAQP